MRTPNKHLTLVVAERGGDTRPWGEARVDGETVVVLQRPEETSAELAQRVRHYVEGLEGAGRGVASAVLVGGSVPANEAFASRMQILRTVSTAMLRRGRGTLVLDGSAGARHAMGALAQVAQEQLRHSGVEVQTPRRAA